MGRLYIPDPWVSRRSGFKSPAQLHSRDEHICPNMHENSQQVKTKFDSKFLNWTPCLAGAQLRNPSQPPKIVYWLPWLPRTLPRVKPTYPESFGAQLISKSVGIYPVAA